MNDMSSLERQIQDVLEAVNAFASNTERRFEEANHQFSEIRLEIGAIKSQMVTKPYLDEKISDLRGELVLLARKSNRKFEALVDELHVKGTITTEIAGRLLSLEPFAR